MAEKARHAFGSTGNLESAVASGAIDAYDILFLDGESDPKVGWIDKNGVIRIVESKSQVKRVDDLPVSDGDADVVYIYNNEAFIWDGEKCVSMSKPANLVDLEEQVSKIETQIGNKIDASEVQTMINTAVEEVASIEVVEF